MKKTQDIVGLSVFSVVDGRQVGQVKDLVINPEEGKVEYLLVSDGSWYAGARVLPFEKVMGIGEHAVTTESETNIASITDAAKANDLLKRNVELKNNRLLTDKGDIIGKVTEYELDENSGIITRLYFQRADETGVEELDAQQVLTYGADVVVVKYQIAANKTKDTIIPIKAKVPAKSTKNDPNPHNMEPLYTATEHLAKAAAEKGEELAEVVVARDQGVRPETTMESLAAMAPVFMQDEAATVTAGNSSQINDAAAGVVLATDEGCKILGKKPIMKMVSWAVIGLEPDIMGIGPALAIPKVLKRAGMTQDQIGLWEINEAFASQSVYVQQTLNLPKDRLNVWGSGISIGHPLACTGARIATDITALFNDPDYADVEYIVESMCIGHGHGAAAIWQRVK
jgi:uncharacterized protein YrrD